jgi:gamma-glutamyltranspeptidase / glutathione hydrolase
MKKEIIDQLTAEAVFGPKKKASSKNGMMVSSHPLVTRVGTDMLRAGGNAVDAVLAAAVAQTVVEPHMCTIFGVLSMMYYDAKSGKTTYLNGSMNVPKAGLAGFGPHDMAGGRAVAVPGFWAAYEEARNTHASKSSAELIAPAIDLARTGFPVYGFLYGIMFEQIDKLGITQEGRDLYFPGGRMLNPGDRLVQNKLADTLEQLAAKGGDYFYRSAFTQKVVDEVKKIGGVLIMEDFDTYETRWVEPARGTYRDFKIAGSPPPDTGGTHIIEILNLLELIPLKEWGHHTQSAETLYWMTRFCHEVFQHGGKYGDPKFRNVPLDLIVSKEFARQRFALMQTDQKIEKAVQPYPGSNHLTVTDAEGNIATVLHSVMSMPWTTGLIIDGVNIWSGGAHFMRNLPDPGARGTCYVAPHIIFDAKGKPVLAAGSPSIGLIQNCVQNAVNILDFGMDIEQSIHTPRFGSQSIASMSNPMAPPSFYVEHGCGTAEMHTELQDRGMALHKTSPFHFHNGSYEGIHFLADGRAEACGDPRRASKAEGI